MASKCRKMTVADHVRAAEKSKGSKLTNGEKHAAEKLAKQGTKYVCGAAPRRRGR